jgi:hypothetical protein
MGLEPHAFTARNREYIAEGIAASLPGRMSSSALQKMSDAVLFTYSFVDKVNRAMTLSMADQMTYDLMRKSKLAGSSLRNMPPSIQREALASIARGDSVQLNTTLARYLNASTQYNYNRASLSQFGRTMGPLFSTFSKWPSATAGDIISEFRQKGLLHGTFRNAEKYIAPWMLLQAFDTLVLGERKDQDLSDRKQLAFGKSGLSGSAPIGTVKSLVSGDFFTPPAIDYLMKGVILPAMSGDTDKMNREFHKAIEGFMPGYVLYKAATKDIPTYVHGYKPDTEK